MKAVNTMNATQTNQGTAQGSRRWSALLLGAACLLIGSAALAQGKDGGAASAASIERLMQLNGTQKALEQAVGGIEVQVRQQIIASLVQQNGGGPLSAQQQVAVSKSVPGIGVVLRQELGWAKLKGPYIELYQSQLKQPDVDQLIKLHQDPGYVSLMQKMQVVNQQAAHIVTRQMPGITHRIQPVLESALKEALGK